MTDFTLDDWLGELIDELPDIDLVVKPEWDSLTMQLRGKHFGRISATPWASRVLTIKGDPDNNRALVEQYASVTPGYYANKRLWISLDLDATDVPLQNRQEAFRIAYALCRESLPQRVQADLGAWDG